MRVDHLFTCASSVGQSSFIEIERKLASPTSNHGLMKCIQFRGLLINICNTPLGTLVGLFGGLWTKQLRTLSPQSAQLQWTAMAYHMERDLLRQSIHGSKGSAAIASVTKHAHANMPAKLPKTQSSLFNRPEALLLSAMQVALRYEHMYAGELALTLVMWQRCWLN